jgi:hypothetical protein
VKFIDGAGPLRKREEHTPDRSFSAIQAAVCTLLDWFVSSSCSGWRRLPYPHFAGVDTSILGAWIRGEGDLIRVPSWL